MPEKSDYAKYLDYWRSFRKENPEAYTIASILPVSGQLTAVADYAEAMDRGDSTDGVLAAASFIPGVKLAKYGSKLAPASFRLKSQMSKTERAIAPLTKNTEKIGKAAAAEQVAEYAVNKGQEYTNPKTDEDQYLEAWASNR